MAPLIALALLAGPAAALRPDLQAPAATLRFLTYNIQGVVPLGEPDEETVEAMLTRFSEIGRRLRKLREEGTAPHVVVLQEAFYPWSDAVAQEAGYPYVEAGPPARLGKLRSGLFVLSEFPIERAERVTFEQCAGWDCLANKGVLHARLSVPGLGPLDVYDTHLNATVAPVSHERAQEIRMAQARLMAGFVGRTNAGGAPAILAGDFNFQQGERDYALFVELTGAANALERCARSSACGGDEDQEAIFLGAIDHQFLRTGPGTRAAPTFLRRAFKERYRGLPLSDHLGVEVHYLLAPAASAAAGGR